MEPPSSTDEAPAQAPGPFRCTGFPLPAAPHVGHSSKRPFTDALLICKCSRPEGCPELRAAGCAAVLEEHASGADRSRPVLARLLHEIQAGETLVVVRLDRLARCGISVSAGFCGESVRRVSADTGFRSGN
jgi:Resolvase, N terminal domain